MIEIRCEVPLSTYQVQMGQGGRSGLHGRAQRGIPTTDHGL